MQKVNLGIFQVDFHTKSWVRFGLRFGSVRFGPVRFSTRGSAEHRTFKTPGSVVLYVRYTHFVMSHDRKSGNLDRTTVS